MPKRRDYKKLQHRLAAVLAPFTIRKKTKRAFEVWALDGRYVCMVVLHPSESIWAATHNMVPEPGNRLYRYANPQAAVQGYAVAADLPGFNHPLDPQEQWP